MQFILLIILVQALYSVSDLVRKFVLHGREFNLSIANSLPFWITVVLSLIGFVIQLYVLKHFDLSRTIIIMGCTAVVFSAILGVIFFKERLGLYNIIGVGFAVLAIIFINIKK